METKNFKYQLEVDAVPYNEETVEYLFGKGSKYNPDFPEDIFAHEIVLEMIKDAISYCLGTKIDFLAKTKKEQSDSDVDISAIRKNYLKLLEEKEEKYRNIEKKIRKIK